MAGDYNDHNNNNGNNNNDNNSSNNNNNINNSKDNSNPTVFARYVELHMYLLCTERGRVHAGW